MKNSILDKEDKYIKEGYKQIYPNGKDIKVSLFNWVSDWRWICNSFQTRKLSFIEAFKNRGNKFLDVEDNYEEASNLQLRLTKNSQKQIYSISDIFIMTNGKELTRLTEKTVNIIKILFKRLIKFGLIKTKVGYLFLLIINLQVKKEKKLLPKKQKKMKLENQSLNCLNKKERLAI